MAAASAAESASRASTPTGVIAFHTSPSGRTARESGCRTKVSPRRANAVLSSCTTRPTAYPGGQSGSSPSTTSDRPRRSALAVADGV
jgi:hypothetical protein